MHRTLKFRIYPTPDQETYLAKAFGARRWIYNHFLDENQRRFRDREKHIGHFDMCKLITHLKKVEETAWLREIDDWALKNAAEDLDSAYTNFFNSIKGKRKGHKVELPKFKSKHRRQSFRTRGMRIVGGGIHIPKVKTPIKAVFHREIEGEIKLATISKDPSGKYFVSILVDSEQKLLPATWREVGIDVGLKDLAITSDGHKFAHPEQMLAKAKQRLKVNQRKLAKMTKGSKSYQRQKRVVARCFERVTNIRNAYYHNLSSFLVKNYDAIYMEDLNVKGMRKNRKLSRKIHESAWSTFSGMVQYKAGFYGKTFHRIGRFFPSTKACSSCGHRYQNMTLGIREWTCPECHTHHDRDLNAAFNIKKQGQLDVYGRYIPSDATAEVGEIPMALQKHTVKIERSGQKQDQLVWEESKPDPFMGSGS